MSIPAPFPTAYSTHGLTEGEPVIRPDYSNAEEADCVNVRLPNGNILCIEYQHDDDKRYNLFLLSADAETILNKF